MSEYRRVRNERCEYCDGTGKLEYGKGGRHPGVPDPCFYCDSAGYRIIYENEAGYERSVTVEHHKLGIIDSYFNNCCT